MVVFFNILICMYYTLKDFKNVHIIKYKILKYYYKNGKRKVTLNSKNNFENVLYNILKLDVYKRQVKNH